MFLQTMFFMSGVLLASELGDGSSHAGDPSCCSYLASEYGSARYQWTTPASQVRHDERDRNAPERVPPDPSESASGNLTLGRPAGSTAAFAWKGAGETDYVVDPVRCEKTSGKDIGRMDFKYRAFCDTGGNPDQGGAALEGGFVANGVDPCNPDVQKPGTEYIFVQTISTTHPLGGRGPGIYVDADDPVATPQYPFGSNDADNPGGDAWTTSFYDGPRRNERADEDITWLAELMLCCRNGRKINVIGSFLWGFDITADGMPNDGTVNVSGTEPQLWGPATAVAIRAVSTEAYGTRTRRGWRVYGEGCCCRPLALHEGHSDNTGLCSVLLENGVAGDVIDQVAIFPRNRQVDPATFLMEPPPGWLASSWPALNIAPPLPFELTGSTMFENGLLYQSVELQPGPSFPLFQFQLAGHESFLDIYVHHFVEDVWIPYVVPTQQLLGDMNGDGAINNADLPQWDFAFSDPVGYQLAFGLDPVFAGDLNHNDSLDLNDRNLLEADILFELETDAVGPAEPCDETSSCSDGNVCTFDFCEFSSGFCDHGPNKYGDVNHDTTVSLFDLFCVLDGFADVFDTCSFEDIDIEPCAGNETINLLDLFAVLDAFSDVDPCCGGG